MPIPLLFLLLSEVLELFIKNKDIRIAIIIIDIVNNSWHIFLKHSHTYAVISKES